MKSAPLFFLLSLILLIDYIASGLFLPTALHLIQTHNSTDLNMRHLNRAVQDITFGLGFMILLLPTYLLSLPIVGVASDQWGRKPFLSLAVICGVIGYLGVLGGLYFNSFPIILFAVLVFGISGTDLPIIMAITTDISSSQTRVKYFTIIQGIVLSYGIVGQWENDFFQLQWTNSLNLPIHILEILILMQVISFIIVRCLPETLTQKSTKPSLKTEEILNRKMELFSTPGIKSLLIYLSITYFSWGLYIQSRDIFISEILHWNSSQNHLYLITRYTSILIGLFVIYFLMKRFRHENLLLPGIILSSMGVLGSAFFQNSFWYILFAFPLNFGALLTIISCWTLLSSRAGRNQGLLMCMTQLSWALTWVFSGICATYLAQNSVKLFFSIDAVFSIIFLAGVIWYERNKTYCYSK